MRLSFNVYLLQETVADPTLAVKVQDFDSQFNVPIGGERIGTLYYGSTESVPEWFSTLVSLSDVSETMTVASATGVLVVRVDERWCLVSFGSGWQKIDRFKVVRNFGIRCALNLSVKDALRGIRRDRIASQTIQAIEQIPDSDDITRFGMDVYRDLLRGVKAGVDSTYRFGPSVSGADGFKATIDLESESIYSYLSRCLEVYRRDSYKKDFKWVDNIYPVRDQWLKFRLTYQLLRRLRSGPSEFVFCVPDIVSWDVYDLTSFERKKPKAFPVAYDFDLAAWLGYLDGKKRKLGFSALYKEKVYLYSDAGQSAGAWAILECIHGTVEYKGSIYVIHGGDWFCLDREYVQDVENQLALVNLSSATLPGVKSRETEPKYNERVTNESKGELFKLDAKLIQHGQRGSKIEVCDILTKDCALICVKPWGNGSSSLSHLFQQAVVAAKLIVNDQSFVKKVAQKLTGDFSVAWEIACDSKNVEVVLAILRGPDKEKLPFFAKLALVTCVSMLREMRFNPTYLPVPIER